MSRRSKLLRDMPATRAFLRLHRASRQRLGGTRTLTAPRDDDTTTAVPSNYSGPSIHQPALDLRIRPAVRERSLTATAPDASDASSAYTVERVYPHRRRKRRRGGLRGGVNMDRGIDLDVIMPILNDYTESLINFGPNDSHYNVNKRARDALINNGMHFNGANELVLGLEALVATGVPDTDAYDKIINSALQTHLLSATGKLGGAAPPQELYKLAAEQAYDKQQRALPGGYEPVPGGTATVRAWKKASDPDLLIGVRGTDDRRDMSANASLLYNGLRGTNRYKADEATVRKIVAAHPGAKVHLASHSLGAAVAREMENILPVATSRAFNAAFQPSTFSKPGVQERHYKGSDFLGQIGRYLPGAKHIAAPADSSKSKWYDPRTWNAFKHHSLSGFGRKRKGGAMRRDRYGLPPDLVLRPSSTGVFPTMPHVRSIDFPATPAGRAAYRAAVRENQVADLHNKEVEALRHAGPGLGGSRFIGGSTSDPDMDMYSDANSRRRRRRVRDRTTFGQWQWIRRLATSPTAAFRNQILAVLPPGWRQVTVIDWPRTFAAWDSGTLERENDDGQIQGYYFREDEPHSLTGIDEDLELSSTTATPESVIETRSRNASVTEEPPVSDREDEMESGGSRKRRRGGSRVLLTERRDVARFGDSPPTTFRASAPQRVADPYQRARLGGVGTEPLQYDDREQYELDEPDEPGTVNSTHQSPSWHGINDATRFVDHYREARAPVLSKYYTPPAIDTTGAYNESWLTILDQNDDIFQGALLEAFKKLSGSGSIGGGNRNYSVIRKHW